MTYVQFEACMYWMQVVLTHACLYSLQKRHVVSISSWCINTSGRVCVLLKFKRMNKGLSCILMKQNI